MSEAHDPVSHGNLPDNPPKPKSRGQGKKIAHSKDKIPPTWVPQEVRKVMDPCEACGVPKPVEEFSRFFERELTLNSDEAVPMLCNYCAVYGAPLDDPLKDLSVAERQAMLMMASGGTVARASRLMDISQEKLRDQLTGREKSVIRGAFVRLLCNQGLGPDAIANAIERSIEGKKMQWNPKDECFEEHEDLSAQMRAADMLVKIFDLKPPQELARNTDPSGPRTQTVNFYTNVGDGKEAKRDEYLVRGTVVDGE